MKSFIMITIVHFSQQVLFGQMSQSYSIGSFKIRKPAIDSATITYYGEIYGDNITIDTAYNSVDDMPEFPGGQRALMQYLSSIKYPKKAMENDIEGSVYVRFIINESGLVTNAMIAKGADDVLNKAALEWITSMPLWKPGRLNGTPVKVNYVVPIKFSLQ